jgi:hypothetical protein
MSPIKHQLYEVSLLFRLVCEDSKKWVKWPISKRSVIHSQENETMTFTRDIDVKQEHLYVKLDPHCFRR